MHLAADRCHLRVMEYDRSRYRARYLDEAGRNDMGDAVVAGASASAGVRIHRRDPKRESGVSDGGLVQGSSRHAGRGFEDGDRVVAARLRGWESRRERAGIWSAARA